MLRTVIIRTALFCMLWWMLTGGNLYGWIVGAITIVIAVAVSVRLQPPGRQRIRLAGLPAFFIYFVAKSVAGGVQVAMMAGRPRIQLCPAMLEMRLRLPQEAERIFLACILSLLPGTLSAGLDGSLLRLHVLDANAAIEEEVREAESRVARLFGTKLP
jgi:multicomponent Na+:H+ antiporter subunit E